MASLMTSAYSADATGPRRRLLGRRWWRLWTMIGNLVIFAVVATLWHRPYWRLADVVYEGPPVWEEKARACVVVPEDSNFVHIDCDMIATRLAAAFQERADVGVKLRLPNTLSVRLTPVAPALWLSAQIGVGVDGSVLAQPVLSPSCPTVRLPAAKRSRLARTDPVEAAGTWAQVLAAEQRFADVVSEWCFDPAAGWTMTADDGHTCFVLGRSRLGARAAAAASFLAQADSLLLLPCNIDLRFDGQIVARRRGHDGHRAQHRDDRAPSALQTRRQARGNTAEEGKGA